MFVNIKYLIVTIAAVFFSLGIGIMIGFNLNNSEIFTQQQIKLVNDMDTKLNELRQIKEDLEKQIVIKDKSNLINIDFIEQFYNNIIEDKLLNKNILIIKTTDDYFFSDITQWGEVSGVNIHSYLQINYNMFESITYQDYPLLFTEYVLDKDKLYNYILELVMANDNTNLFALQEKGLIKIISQANTANQINHVLILGGEIKENIEKIEEVDVKFVDAIKIKNLPITFAEESTANHSSVSIYKKNQISTIDNVDQNIGIVSLTYQMLGFNGHYGIKETADKLFPNQKE